MERLFAVIALLVLCSGLHAKSCSDKVKELAASPPLLGAFHPKCQPNGLYEEIQCHENYCYCVKPETGEELAGTRIQGSKPKSCKITPCIEQRDEVIESGLMGAFIPDCETDGSYKPIQNHEGFYFCAFQETGKEILGTRQSVRMQKPKSCKPTQCFMQRHEVMESGLRGAFRPQCEDDGSYKAIQCHEGYCYCVFPKTGEEITGTRLTVRGQRPKSCKHTPCVMQRHKALKSQLMGIFIPDCKADGSYEPIQNHEGFYYCVFPDTGKQILGTEQFVRMQKPKSCDQPTPCMLQRHNVLNVEQPLLGAFKPECNDDGSFKDVQCKEGYCYCIFPKTGKKVLGTMGKVRGVRPKSCKLTQCFLSRHQGLVQSNMGLLGVFVSRCDDNGSYSKVQCWKTTCWCVDPLTGGRTKQGNSVQAGSEPECD